jgi:hypothetical protein
LGEELCVFKIFFSAAILGLISPINFKSKLEKRPLSSLGPCGQRLCPFLGHAMVLGPALGSGTILLQKKLSQCQNQRHSTSKKNFKSNKIPGILTKKGLNGNSGMVSDKWAFFCIIIISPNPKPIL